MSSNYVSFQIFPLMNTKFIRGLIKRGKTYPKRTFKYGHDTLHLRSCLKCTNHAFMLDLEDEVSNNIFSMTEVSNKYLK